MGDLLGEAVGNGLGDGGGARAVGGHDGAGFLALVQSRRRVLVAHSWAMHSSLVFSWV